MLSPANIPAMHQSKSQKNLIEGVSIAPGGSTSNIVSAARESVKESSQSPIGCIGMLPSLDTPSSIAEPPSIKNLQGHLSLRHRRSNVVQALSFSRAESNQRESLAQAIT